MNRILSVKTQKPDNQWYFTSAFFGQSMTKSLTSSVITNFDLQNYAASNFSISNAPSTDVTNQGLVRDYNYFSAATNEVQITESKAGTDPRLSKVTYDRLNRITQNVTPLPDAGIIPVPIAGLLTKAEYDNLGNITKSIDPLNNATVWFYDDLNRVTKISEPHPTSTASTFDTAIVYSANGSGWSTTTTNPLGLTSIVQADMLGRPINVSGTSQPAKSIRYWMDGNVQSTTDEVLRRTKYYYDTRSRLTSTETPPADSSSNLGAFTNYYYTIDSLLSSVGDPLNRTTTFQYDAGGRLQQVTEPDPDGAGTLTSAYNKVSRDSLGNVRSQTDALNHSSSYTQDAWFRNVTQIDPLGNTTTTVYDVFGNVLSVLDPLSNLTQKNLTTYSYNNLNQLTAETKGTYGNRSYSYDAAGNLKQLTDRNNRVTNYNYDNRYRLTSETWASIISRAGV